MGKMNMLNTKLSNGDVGRDCEVEAWCHSPAYVLSWTDKKLGHNLNSPIQRYSRTIRYKCRNGHYFEKQSSLDKDLFSAPKTLEKE